MEASAADAAARRQRDWSCLPAGVLQLAFGKASAWQTPGPCLAAPVCRSWGSAASGCKGFYLLYHAGHPATDRCFTAWLGRNSHKLDTLTLGVSRDKISKWANQHDTDRYSAETVLVPLADAAEEAAAAGRPLPLHTLRVFGPGPDLDTVGRLVRHLPRLRCLQLTLDHPGSCDVPVPGSSHLKMSWVDPQHLAPLQAATQLEELHLRGPLASGYSAEDVAKHLQPSLKRLSWQPLGADTLPNLSHLSQLTFLQLARWPFMSLDNDWLPPGLQQLEVRHMRVAPEVLTAQQQVLVGCHVGASFPTSTQQQPSSFSKVTAASVQLQDMHLPAVKASLQRLSSLATLRAAAVHGAGDKGRKNLGVALATAGALSNLRHLDLQLKGLPAPKGLAALTGLTRLRLSVPDCNSDTERRKAWAQELSSMARLRWLSVPDVLLAAGWAWLGGLQQLRVLVLNQPVVATAASGGLAWVDGCNPQVLPPSLRVLGWGGIDAEEAAAWQLYRGLNRRLQGSGCEVVVGVDLDEVTDPAQQLAGLPVALQQLLA